MENDSGPRCAGSSPVTELISPVPDKAADHDEVSAYEDALRRKVQRQALELSSCRDQIAWSSDYARSCEEHVRRLDPSTNMNDPAVRKVRLLGDARNTRSQRRSPLHRCTV